MNTKASPPGWDEYAATVRELQANHLMTPAAASRMASAGKALGIAAFEAGADAMEAAAAEIMRSSNAQGSCAEHVPAAGGKEPTCTGPGRCPNQHNLARLDQDCPVCGGRDPLPF